MELLVQKKSRLAGLFKFFLSIGENQAALTTFPDLIQLVQTFLCVV